MAVHELRRSHVCIVPVRAHSRSMMRYGNELEIDLVTGK